MEVRERGRWRREGEGKVEERGGAVDIFGFQ
jgi:hypothetical protein